MAWSLQEVSSVGTMTHDNLKSGDAAKRLAKELKDYRGDVLFRVFDPAGHLYQWAEVKQGGSWRIRWQWAR